MNLHKGKFMRACESKWRKMESSALTSSLSSPPADCEELICCPWPCLHHLHKISSDSGNSVSIPKDVPKGHMAVYVGQSLKRYVIKITLLEHPLFRALLDQARDEYGFATISKLCIPCDENMFLDAIQCASMRRL